MIQNTAAMQSLTAITAQPPRTFDRNKAMAPVAKLLDMSVDELKTALKSGQTLDKIAAGKGISHTDLVAAIKQGLQDAQPNGTVRDLDKAAENLATGKGHFGHRHHSAPPAADANAANSGALETVSSMLKMSSSDLVTALTSGTSLVDLAEQHGVSSDSLLQAAGRGMVLNTVA